MRTPGHDFELAAGFLFDEGIISSAYQIRGITNSEPNIVVVELSAEVVIQPAQSQRGLLRYGQLDKMRALSATFSGPTLVSQCLSPVLGPGYSRCSIPDAGST